MLDYTYQIVGLFGHPVAENPTGVMQEAAFQAAGLRWRYLNFDVAPARLAECVAAAKVLGFRGLNVTIPHKVAIVPLLDEVAPAAVAIGAVNTVRRDGDRWIGENTDGKGFLRGLEEDAGVDPRGKRAMLIGAGGAARAIATELALAGIATLRIVNRDPERARALASALAASTGLTAQIESWTGPLVLAPDTDLLINATPLGLYPAVNQEPEIDWRTASPHLTVCDAVFNPAETALLRRARRQGFRTLDGLSMLVYQGVIGFELWTGQAAPQAVMKEALAAALRTRE